MLQKCRKAIAKLYTIFTAKPCLWVLRRDGLIYGKNFNVQNYVSIDISHCFLIKIGDDVTLAPGAMILAHDASTKLQLGYTKIARVEIGNKVFIGARAIILPGVKIGDNAIIGAGAVVSKDVSEGTVVAGVPAREVMKTVDYLEKFKKKKLDGRMFDKSFTLGGGLDTKKRVEMLEKLGTEWGGVV